VSQPHHLLTRARKARTRAEQLAQQHLAQGPAHPQELTATHLAGQLPAVSAAGMKQLAIDLQAQQQPRRLTQLRLYATGVRAWTQHAWQQLQLQHAAQTGHRTVRCICSCRCSSGRWVWPRSLLLAEPCCRTLALLLPTQQQWLQDRRAGWQKQRQAGQCHPKSLARVVTAERAYQTAAAGRPLKVGLC
jgi:hypothetical protein